jgi:RND family efflux transporter MFP subunit
LRKAGAEFAFLRHLEGWIRQILEVSLERRPARVGAFLRSEAGKAAHARSGFKARKSIHRKQIPREPVRREPVWTEGLRVRNRATQRRVGLSCLVLAGLMAAGCKGPANPAAKGPGMQAFPVQIVTVTMAPVPQSSEYVATIKSRRSATLQAQVAGLLTQIRVRSGDHVKAGAILMEIDPRQQMATVQALRATERQKKALFDFDTIEQERQHKLFEAGVTSRDAYDQSRQAFENAKADFESATEARKTQEELLAYYTVRAPFDGVVGDIPVHVGDYVTPALAPGGVLTTVDENKDLEAYIYVPTERSSQVRQGLDVELTDNSGKLLERTKIDFLSQQVDSASQGILVKAPVRSTPEMLRTAQIIKARVIWATTPMAVVPVLAVTRQGGQSFVFVAKQQNGMTQAIQTPVTLGDTVGNSYAVSVGLQPGDKVIVSSTQFLVNGMPVMPMGG